MQLLQTISSNHTTRQFIAGSFKIKEENWMLSKRKTGIEKGKINDIKLNVNFL